MQEKDIQGIISKVEELRGFFTTGAKFIPLLEDMLVFVQDMAPILAEMNQSILESTSKMPKAVQQLDKVTSATELATNEILDRVESMLSRLDNVQGKFNLLRQRLSAERDALGAIAGAIEELLVLPGVRDKLNKLFEDKAAREKGILVKKIVDDFLAGRIDESVSESVDQALRDIQTDAYDIMNALQVQDITAQQVEGAHALLNSIQERLSKLLARYTQSEAPPNFRQARAHDMDASYVGGEERQQKVDEAMQEFKSEDAPVVPDEEVLPESSAFEETGVEVSGQTAAEEPADGEIDQLLSWGADGTSAGLPGEEEITVEPGAEAGLAAEEEAGGELLEEPVEALPEIELEPEPGMETETGGGLLEESVEALLDPEPELEVEPGLEAEAGGELLEDSIEALLEAEPRIDPSVEAEAEGELLKDSVEDLLEATTAPEPEEAAEAVAEDTETAAELDGEPVSDTELDSLLSWDSETNADSGESVGEENKAQPELEEEITQESATEPEAAEPGLEEEEQAPEEKNTGAETDGSISISQEEIDKLFQ